MQHVTPGEVLRDVIERHGITQQVLADAMMVSRLTVNEIIGNHRAVTPAMAFRLSRVLRTTPDFWLNLQRTLDFQAALEELGDELEKLKPIVPKMVIEEMT